MGASRAVPGRATATRVRAPHPLAAASAACASIHAHPRPLVVGATPAHPPSSHPPIPSTLSSHPDTAHAVPWGVRSLVESLCRARAPRSSYARHRYVLRLVAVSAVLPLDLFPFGRVVPLFPTTPSCWSPCCCAPGRCFPRFFFLFDGLGRFAPFCLPPHPRLFPPFPSSGVAAATGAPWPPRRC